MKRVNLVWLACIGLVAGLIDLSLPHPTVFLADPISGSILVSLAISAAVTAASVGVEYLVARRQKVAPVDRGKQDDIRVSVPGYGESIVKGWGTFRCAPIWVWHTPIVHTTVTTPGQSGGKGSPRPPTPDTIDHVYTTSLAGIFHDGIIYKGASRIWFDNDLVFNANFANNFQALASTRYEAEWGVLAGGASVATQSECSGGKKVTGLGSGGTVTLSVTVASTASYECAVYYTSTVDRTFKVSVNGGATVDLVCIASGAASIVAIETLSVSLTAGSNTIAFSNSGAACPDLDYIDVVPALSFTDGKDLRAFSGLMDPNRVPPTDPDHSWAFNNEIPTFSDTTGGVTGGGYYSTTLSKYGQPSIRIYPGSETQTADSAIIADKGVASAPAYRGFAYIVIEGLQLQNGRIPNVTIEVNQGVRELPTIVSDIYNAVGVASTNLELTALNGMVLGDNEGFSAGTYSSITWANLVNATQTAGGAITKTSGTQNTWNARADASSVASGDASIRFTAGTGTFMVGFSTTATPGSTLPNPYNQVPFAILLNINSNPSQEVKNSIQMSLGGSTNSYDVGTWSPGDQFQVELRDGRFAAYQNGIELTGFNAPPPVYPLYFIYMGYATGGGPSAASKATGASIGSLPSVSNGGGLLLSSRRAAGELIQDLQTRFQFDLPEVDGKVKAVLRNGTSEVTITSAELRAHYDGEEMPAYDALITDADPLLLPKTVNVNYLDPGLDYHNNTQFDMRLVGPQYDEQSVSLSLVDSATNMKKLASTLLYKPEREGREYKFTTGPKYMRLHQGTVVTLTLANTTHVVRVKEARYGLPAGVCEFEAVRQQASLYSPTGTGSISTGFEPPIAPIPANTTGDFVDGPLVYPENVGDNAQPWLYMGMSGRGSGTWSGGFLYREFPHNSGNYELVTSSDKPAAIGITSTALLNVEDPSVTDLTSLLVVQFYSAVVLSSVTEAELLANPKLNLIAVVSPSGDVEYVQFRTAEAATPSAPFVSKYVLTKFLRGLNDTENNVGVHTTADEVMIMDSAVKVVPMDVNDIGVSRNYKFVTSGQAVTDAAIIPFTWDGIALKPHPVTDIRVLQDGVSDTAIEFETHPRLTEIPATFAVDIYTSATYSTLKRSLTITAGTSQAALLVTQNPNDTVGGKGEQIITSAHTDNNNLIHIVGGVVGSTLQIIDDYYMRIDFTFKDSHATTPYLTLDQFAGLYEDGTSDALSTITSEMPCSLRVKQGTGSTADIEILNYATVVETLNYTYAELKAGLRFTIVVMSNEYRVYQDYILGGPAIAVIATASTGPPFPLRGIFEVVETLDIRNIIIGTGRRLKTIYSAREQIKDFGSLPAVVYGRIYQKSPSPIPHGWPVDVIIQTAGGFLLLEGGTDKLLKEGGTEKILKE